MPSVRKTAVRAAVPAVLAILTAAVQAAGATPRAANGATASTALYGRTTQGTRVQLGAQRGALRAFRYRAELKCSDGSTFLDSFFTDDVRLRLGRFSDRHSSSRGAVVTDITGKVAATSASGTIRIVERYSEVPNTHGDTPLDPTGAIICASGVVGWHARAT